MLKTCVLFVLKLHFLRKKEEKERKRKNCLWEFLAKMLKEAIWIYAKTHVLFLTILFISV